MAQRTWSTAITFAATYSRRGKLLMSNLGYNPTRNYMLTAIGSDNKSDL